MTATAYEDARRDHGLATPVVLTPKELGPNLALWIHDNSEVLNRLLYEHGAILFRKFKLNGSRDFEQMIAAVGEPLIEYNNRSTPRTQIRGKIYTSTEYPASETIPLHNENSYTHAWAMKLFFFCVKAPEVGGETPIADSRRVYERIAPAIREEFIRKQVRYVRNYGCLDLPWQESFQTSSAEEVENACKANRIEFQWFGDGRLKTWQTLPAIARHPVTKQNVWFNQAHLFHVSNLSTELQSSLLSSVGEEELPRNAYYGDGTRIDAAALAEIRRVYDAEEIVFPWLSGDVLLLDNMLFAHGRKPFSGPRQVLVGMTSENRKHHLEGDSDLLV